MTDPKTSPSPRDRIVLAARALGKLAPMIDAKTCSRRAMLDAVRSATAAVSDLESVLAALETEVERQIAAAMTEIEADLVDLARRRSWRIEGGWPTYQIERGIELRVEPMAGIVRLAGRPIDGTDLAAVETAIAEQAASLLPKRFAPHEFLEQIERAWRALSDRTPQVSIFDLYARLVVDQQSPRFWRDAVSDRFVALSSDQFRARLSAMLDAGVTTTRDGRELRLLPPIDPKDALFVYQPAERRFAYVGRVEFLEGSAR